ncbi:hypothetical protein GXP71_16480 [Cellulomonas sp. H30R-01]|uniref:DUF3566 domain-containing protein n=1 Tax=Cellulomonas sp. H30R-01 TaxID=2704467 RepID=UPI00138BBBC2|nr:DUF3566 domain-containing protein [Cellulomonas sp. H30R-01]QHT57507.1 hypothetical protein GXP71_16480 [Cellulomonas sp. H30R-01]
MTDSTPPSIPPRLRPTTPTTARPGTSSGAKSTAKSPTAARNGRSRTESASSAPKAVRPAPADEKPSSETDGVSTPKRDEPPYRASAGVPPRTSASTAASASDEGEQPSPLMVAVDTATVWFKKAAGATSAAFASVTRPRTEDPTMSSPAPAPAAATSPTAARTSTRPPATGATSQVRPATGRIPTVGGPRRVRLAVSRIDPWSVMKLSFLLSVAIGIMIVVAAAVIWLTLDGLHVFTEANNLVKQITGEESSINILQYVEFRRVVSGATLIAVIDVFLLTALSTIGAFLYNIVAALVGGVHVTMTDE